MVVKLPAIETTMCACNPLNFGIGAKLKLFSLFALLALLSAFPTLAQSQKTSSISAASISTAPKAGGRETEAQESTGCISGTIVDQSGAFVAGAIVVLTRPDQPSAPSQQVVSDEGGQFFFVNVAPGRFQLSISSADLKAEIVAGTVDAGEVYKVPQVTLAVATNVTEVHVSSATQIEIAQAQVKEQEKQRVLGIVPNFFVTYDEHPVPLSSKQKFELAWKVSIDPFTIGAVAGVAGLEQRQNTFAEYGGGVQGYFKRFGATYADVVDGTFFGSAIMPSLLHQDPRYFYRGTGSFRSRLVYALRSSIICKGDNGEWQPNYSSFLGNLAAGGIANAYLPANKRGVGIAFETAGIRIGETAIAGVFQEFFSRKLTPSTAKRTANSQP
jgi:hypothetical protein